MLTSRVGPVGESDTGHDHRLLGHGGGLVSLAGAGSGGTRRELVCLPLRQPLAGELRNSLRETSAYCVKKEEILYP